MKKITKFVKILMVFIMIFSQLSTVTAVLADELGEEEIVENENNESIEENENDEESIVENENLLLKNIDEQESESDYLFDDSETNDSLLNDLYSYELYFQGGYLFAFAKGYLGNDYVPTISEIVNGIVDTDITLSINNGEEELDLTNEEVLASEVKNEYQIIFTDKNETSVTYSVIVTADDNLDNEFNEEDVKLVIEDYLNEKNVLSMDVIAPIDSKEEFGTITFEDVMIFNGALNGSQDDSDNVNLGLSFSRNEEEVFVGDKVELSVIVNSNNEEDFIDGLDGNIISENLELTDVIFGEGVIGNFTDDGRIVLVGSPISNGNTVMTLVLTATEDGVGTVSLDGSIARYLNINEFDTISEEIEISRKVPANNNLASLNASVGNFDLEFDKDITEYVLTVPYDTESVILSGSVEDVDSKVDGLIEYTLTEDETVAVIIVTALDGTTKTYTVRIVKEEKKEEVKVATPIVYYYSSNNYLKSLEIDGYEIDFNRDVFEYNVTVNNRTTSLDIKALPEDYRSRVQITGNDEFIEGENIVTITVTAEDGSTRDYKIIVNKEKAKTSSTLTEIDDDDESTTAEKVIIIVLIILVVLGLLYLIFKKDDEEIVVVKNEKENKSKEVKKENNNNYNKKNKNNKK